MQGLEAVSYADAVTRAAVRGKLLLEAFDLPLQHVPARFHDPVVRGVQFIPQLFVGRPQIQKRCLHQSPRTLLRNSS